MKALVVGNVFYVYEHWRPDTNVCFHVGKGYGDRAWYFRGRNYHYTNIFKKLKRLGMVVDVRVISTDLSETEALRQEIERVAYWRALGVKLTNLTNGGEGVAGYRHTKETRELIKRRIAGRVRSPLSEETKKKISASK